MGLLLFFFAISIIFSFLCSIWEAVLLSITPSFAQQKLQEGGVIGKTLDEFKKNIDRPLAAILTLNTIAHTVGAMGVGAQAQTYFAGAKDLPFGLSMEAVIGAVMTLAILLLSEIIPKTLGANYWRSLTPFTVKSLRVIMFLLAPLVWVSQLITKAMKKDKNKSVLTRHDFTAMAEIGEKEGVIEEGESKIIRNLLRFKTILTKDIMTPRTVVKAAPEDQSLKDFYEENKNLRFSRIPIYEESKDQINGFILKDELLQNLINNNGDAPLKDIMREIMIINEQFPVPDLFSKFMENREHIALVVDEFGGMAGLVSMEDVIETLLGMEIVDEFDNDDDMQALARKNWEKRAKRLGLIENEIPDDK